MPPHEFKCPFLEPDHDLGFLLAQEGSDSISNETDAALDPDRQIT